MTVPRCLRCGQILFPGIEHRPVFILEIVPNGFPIKNTSPGGTYLVKKISSNNVILDLKEYGEYIINLDYGKLSCI